MPEHFGLVCRIVEKRSCNMNYTTIAILGIIAMFILLLLGMNIGLAMLLVGFIGYALCVNWQAAFGLLKTTLVNSSLTYSYTVIPLFLLLGEFAFCSEISSNLYDSAAKWLGNIKGGLAIATVAACAGFAAICGSATATCATMGVVAYPEMKKHGYSSDLSTGCISAGGTLGILIPPSTSFIFYSICGEVSVARMFAAGIFPGIVMVLCFIIAIIVWIRIKPDAAPGREKFSLKEKVISLISCIGMVILFLIVIIGIFAGWFSTNEAAAIGAFVSLIFVIIKR